MAGFYRTEEGRVTVYGKNGPIKGAEYSPTSDPAIKDSLRRHVQLLAQMWSGEQESDDNEGTDGEEKV